MKPFLEQGYVRLRLVPEEFLPPDPRPVFRRGFGENEGGVPARYLEVKGREAVPVRDGHSLPDAGKNGDRNPLRDAGAAVARFRQPRQLVQVVALQGFPELVPFRKTDADGHAEDGGEGRPNGPGNHEVALLPGMDAVPGVNEAGIPFLRFPDLAAQLRAHVHNLPAVLFTAGEPCGISVQHLVVTGRILFRGIRHIGRRRDGDELGPGVFHSFFSRSMPC